MVISVIIVTLYIKLSNHLYIRWIVYINKLYESGGTNVKNYLHTLNYSYRRKIGIILTVFIIVMLYSGISLYNYYNHQVEILVDKEAKSTIENVSSQNVIAIKKEIDSKFTLMKSIAGDITNDEQIHLDRVLNDLTAYSDTYGFYNMGVVMPDGTCYTTLDEEMNLAGYDYVVNGFNGKHSVTNSRFSEDKKYMLNIFTYPIQKDGEVIMLLTATYLSSNFIDLLNINSFDGKGQSVVLDNEGNLVAKYVDMEEESLQYYKKLEEENASMFYKLQEDMSKSSKGYIEYQLNNETYLAYYEPIGVNDWYIISFVPRSVVYTNAMLVGRVLQNVNFLVIGFLIIFGIILIITFIRYRYSIMHVLFRDELTKEKNFECLKIDFQKLKRNMRYYKSLIVFDVDKFKTVNMIYGSSYGDEVIIHLARLFHTIFPEDTLYRDSADLFIAIVEHENKEELIKKLNMFHAQLMEDCETQKLVPITISMGICSMNNEDNLHRIYSNALIAKTKVKGKVHEFYGFFDKRSSEEIINNQKLESSFHKAVLQHEFEVWYQPKVDMRSGEIHGAEALVRWRKPDGTLVPPGKFISLFEHNRQIVELDKLVIEMVCQDIQAMKKNHQKIVPISVNLSRRHLEQPGLLEKIKQTVEHYEVEPKYLVFEITESALVDDKEGIDTLVTSLQQMGFLVDMDDYGTGTSTIRSLSTSNFNTLKLDKSFIDKIGEEKMDTILRSTISMVRKLHMEIIAEGVETKEQVNFLIANECFIAQGYYFYQPLDKEAFIQLLKY